MLSTSILNPTTVTVADANRAVVFLPEDIPYPSSEQPQQTYTTYICCTVMQKVVRYCAS